MKEKNNGEILLYIVLKFKNINEFIKEYLRKYFKGLMEKRVNKL